MTESYHKLTCRQGQDQCRMFSALHLPVISVLPVSPYHMDSESPCQESEDTEHRVQHDTCPNNCGYHMPDMLHVLSQTNLVSGLVSGPQVTS